MDRQFTEDKDLKTVLEELAGISSKWEGLGIQLEVSPGQLATFKESTDPLMEVLKVWMKGIKPKPTWRGLIKALKSKTVGEKQLADKLGKKYGKKATASSNSQAPKGQSSSAVSKRAATSEEVPKSKKAKISQETTDVPCPYSDFGCKETCRTKAEVKDHEKLAVVEHLHKVMQAVKKLQPPAKK